MQGLAPLQSPLLGRLLIGRLGWRRAKSRRPVLRQAARPMSRPLRVIAAIAATVDGFMIYA